jgi:hypothetical protein
MSNYSTATNSAATNNNNGTDNINAWINAIGT